MKLSLLDKFPHWSEVLAVLTYADEGKALKSVPNAECTPALAAGSGSYQFGRMPDIAAMPVVRKTTAIVKQPHTLLF